MLPVPWRALVFDKQNSRAVDSIPSVWPEMTDAGKTQRLLMCDSGCTAEGMQS
jgi:hypothetical protein